MEREWIDRVEEAGYIDTFRHTHPDEKDRYSWWSVRTGARKRNVGWRIDYFFVSRELEESIEDADILSDIEGSDHAPVTLRLRLPE
jgi:exodeoxyribonuclease-3